MMSARLYDALITMLPVVLLFLQIWFPLTSGQGVLEHCAPGYLESHSLSFNGSGRVTIRQVFSGNINEFTVCFWTRLLDHESLNLGTVFHFITVKEFNEIVIALGKQEGNQKISVNIRNVQISVSTPITNTKDRSWHHVCVTWENVHGHLRIYNDGQLFYDIDDLQKGALLGGRGVHVLSIGRKFTGFMTDYGARQFYGDIAHLNVWSSVLSGHELKKVEVEYEIWCGDILQWSSITENEVVGASREDKPSIPTRSFDDTTASTIIYEDYNVRSSEKESGVVEKTVGVDGALSGETIIIAVVVVTVLIFVTAIVTVCCGFKN
ncbi:C-reactive protein-like [Glandiceps talaboti]